ncbi:MAG TPA: hypothetical protein VK589_15305 [Chryseolinea sp.]|nr:hypothetical protein [Chryseolinea sp.]
MASEKDFEILDEYAGNRLNPQDRAAFEQQLQSDAELKNELSLQREIIEGIKTARKAELKSLLNNVPVTSIPSEGMSTAVKIGLWVVVAGLVSTGLYFYFNQDDNNAAVQPAITNEIKEESIENTVVDDSKAATEANKPEQQEQEATTQAQPKVDQKQAVQSPAPKASTPATVEEQPAVEPSTLDVFDPSQDAENSEQVAAEEIGPKLSTKSSIAVVTEVDKRYNFHYQFRDNKLFLYGSFEKNFYEIMEFFSNNKRTMFLFYKDNYYLLSDSDEKVKPLSAINDAALLKKLRDYRGN